MNMMNGMMNDPALITNLPADRPVKPDHVENSSNSSAILTARHGGHPHSSGIFTFFSFEEGSNFVQNMRPNNQALTNVLGSSLK